MLMALVIILTTLSTVSVSSPLDCDLGVSAPTATTFGANLPKILLLTTLALEDFGAIKSGALLFPETGLATKKDKLKG